MDGTEFNDHRERTELKEKRAREDHPIPKFPSLRSLHCYRADCSQVARKFAGVEGLREDMKRQED
jgi:hypothetical protein